MIEKVGPSSRKKSFLSKYTRHQRKILRIGDRDEWTCYLCGERVDRSLLSKIGPWVPTLDHIDPKSNGGSGSLENLRLAHFECNRSRGTDPVPTPDVCVSCGKLSCPCDFFEGLRN